MFVGVEENFYDKKCIRCGKIFCSKGKTPVGVCEDCKGIAEDVVNDYKVKYLGQWIVEQNDYFRIVKETLENRKTPIYHIETLGGLYLGEIKWYGAWRKFCFFPNKETIWDNKCLKLVIDFLDRINKEWRESKK